MRRLEGLVDVLAARGDVGEEELRDLRGQAGAQIPERCRALADEGRHIEAIKAYRELTGAGLVDAKNAVDQYRAHGI